MYFQQRCLVLRFLKKVTKLSWLILVLWWSFVIWWSFVKPLKQTPRSERNLKHIGLQVQNKQKPQTQNSKGGKLHFQIVFTYYQTRTVHPASNRKLDQMTFYSPSEPELSYSLMRFLFLSMFSEVTYDLIYMEHLITGFPQTKWKGNGIVTCKITPNPYCWQRF